MKDFDYYQISQPEELHPERHEMFAKAEMKWSGLARYFLKNYGKFITAYMEEQLMEGELDILVLIYQYYSPSLRTYNFIIRLPKREKDNEIQLLSKFYFWMEKPGFRQELEKEYSRRGIKLLIKVTEGTPKTDKNQAQPVDPDVCYQLHFSSP